MLYYTSLFLVIVLVSMIAIWIYRGIFGVGRAAYRSSLKGGRKLSKRAKARMKARQKAHGTSATKGVPTPWGWNAATGQMHSDRDISSSGTLRGHARSSEYMFASAPNPVAARKKVDWPHKEEKVEFAGKAYKVNRKVADDGDLDADGKPWVW